MVVNSSPAQSLSLCYCYAHEDAALLDELDKHLATGTQSIRSNRDISEGEDWRLEADGRLDAANLLLLLVTEHLVDSGYFDGVEMQEALKRHEAGEVIILPVIMRPVDWEKTALGSLQTLPRDGQPIMDRDDIDEAFQQIATEVDIIAEQMWGGSPTMVALPAVTVPTISDPAQTPDSAPIQEPETSDPSAVATIPFSTPAQVHEPDQTHESAQQDQAPESEMNLSDVPTVVVPSRPVQIPDPDQTHEPEMNLSDVPTVTVTAGSRPAQTHEPEIGVPDASALPTVPFSKPALADEPEPVQTEEPETSATDTSTITTNPLPEAEEPETSATDTSTITTNPLPEAEEPEISWLDTSAIATVPFPKPTALADEPGINLPEDSTVATVPFLKPAQTEVPTARETKEAREAREARNPYKGLRAFTTGDAGDFFGRAASIDKLALLIESMPAREKKGDPSSRLLAVIGPAGTGKSSLVMAGLVPSLREGGVFDSADWVYLDPIVPGEHPIEALAQTLLVHFPGKKLQTVRADLQDVAGLHLYGTRLIKQASDESTHVVLVIDQFEELFTLTSDEVERRRFVNLLVNACTRQEGPLIVILTLRTDFVARLTEYPGLAALARLHQATPSVPTQDELRAIITRPADLPDVQASFEEGLVDTILSDARGRSEVLPHTQFILHKLFQQRTDDQLTLQAYRELGGVKNALAQCAEQTYRALPSHEHRLATYALFLNLVDLGTVEQGPALLQVKQSDLNVSDDTQTRQIQESLEMFVKAGLLRLHDSQGHDTTVEISHEIVLKAWPRLTEWLRIAREDKLFQQTFTRDVAEWEQHEQTKTRLYRGVQLKKARSWATRHTPSGQEAAFLQASTARRSRFLVNIAVIALLLVALLGAASGYYVSHTPSPLLVTNTSNNGTGSLRWCIDHAPSGSTIMFDPAVRGTITFTGGNLVVGASKELTINGPGAGRLALRSGDTQSSLVVSDGSTLTISGLSFQGSKQAKRSILSNNGMLTLNNSVVSGNASAGDGGGISSTDGILTLNNSVVSGNTAAGNGGGISFFNGTLTLNNSTVMKNTSGKGGGIYMLSGILTMRNSTIASNSSRAGGGIYSSNNTLNLMNDTISDNSAAGNGGGVFTYNSTITLDKSTVFNNTANNNGGGIFNNSANSPAVLHNYPVVLERSIIAGNHSNEALDVSGTVVTRGYNLFEYVAGATFVDPQKLHGTDKAFSEVNDLHIDGVLDKNGGTTMTHALLQGSPAIDAIPISACDLKTAATDQRGVKRPQGRACDIGAYEYQAHP